MDKRMLNTKGNPQVICSKQNRKTDATMLLKNLQIYSHKKNYKIQANSFNLKNERFVVSQSF